MKFALLSICAVVLASACLAQANILETLDNFKDNLVEKVTGKDHDDHERRDHEESHHFDREKHRDDDRERYRDEAEHRHEYEERRRDDDDRERRHEDDDRERRYEDDDHERHHNHERSHYRDDDDQDHDKHEKRHHKDEDEHHSRYEGGIGRQIAHSVADAALERVIYEAEERAPSSLLKPVISLAANKIRGTIHDKINDYGEDEAREGGEERRHDDDDHERHHEQKEESFLQKLFRRKRSAGTEPPSSVGAQQGIVSSILTGIKNSTLGKKIVDKVTKTSQSSTSAPSAGDSKPAPITDSSVTTPATAAAQEQEGTKPQVAAQQETTPAAKQE